VAGVIDTGTRLAIERTRLAHERTLMAWVRTGTSLISFGFTVYKFFQFEISKQQPVPAAGIIGPRGFALMMISIGLVALVLSTIEHRRSMKAMRTEFGSVPYSTAAIVASLVSGLGVVALLAVVLRA
jgi:putative membrane protein